MNASADTNSTDEPAIATDAVTKAYGDLVALAPLDLTIDHGEAVALVGHNGSGKSTLLQMAAGLLDPSDGGIAVEGHAAGSLGARERLTYIGDTPILYDDLSVWEHLEYLGQLHGVDDWRGRGEALLDRLGLTERGDDLPFQFSRGLRQKSALAVGLVRDSPVTLIDEPFVGLDQPGRQALLAEIDERHEAGRTVVLTTHDVDALAHVDRAVVLRNGEVVHDGDPDPDEILRLISS